MFRSIPSFGAVWVAAIILAGLFVFAPNSHAAPIEGKFGLGVDTGDLIDSEPEATLIIGKSEKTAWLWSANVSGSSTNAQQEIQHPLPDTTVVTQDRDDSFFSVTTGPGIRKFVRENGHLSPYFDVVAQFVYSHWTSNDGYFPSDRSQTRVGGQVDLAIGAEYFFEKWPVSLAAHTRLVSARYTHVKEKYNNGLDHVEFAGDSFSASEGLGPRLQVRVYF